MKPVLFIIYQFLRLITTTALKIYFSKRTIINKHFLKVDRPTILVSNHPNTLMDPLNAALDVNRAVHFLANAGLFEAPVLGKLLHTFYCIPVERPKDVNGRMIKNHKNFERCDEFLTAGGCLYIAPEGTSVIEHQLRKLKTGTARIALNTEAKNNFQLGLQILPVGLTYSAATKFRSDVLINTGKPIEVADYRSLFEDDSFKAAKKLTSDLEMAMGELIYNTQNATEEKLILKIEKILNSEDPVDPVAQFYRTKAYIARIRELKNDDPESYKKLSQDLNHYFSGLKRMKINDKAVAIAQKNQSSFKNFLLLCLGFPVFIYGYINNFLAFYTPALIAKKLNIDIGYTSTIKILSGLITVPLFFGLQIWLVHQLFDSLAITLLYSLGLLPTGWFAWEYLSIAKQKLKNFRAKKLITRGDKKMLELKEVRKNMLNSITSISIAVKT